MNGDISAQNVGRIAGVLTGAFAYASFVNGVALDDTDVPVAPPVFNGTGGSMALRIITDAGELSGTVYSGYGNNLSDDNWGAIFSPAIDGNTYIGICDYIDSDSFFTGSVEVNKGVNTGGGVYSYDVNLTGYVENPELNPISITLFTF